MGSETKGADPRLRSPRLGDRITTVEPFRTDTPMIAAGSRAVVMLATEASVEYARYLIASGRWMICEADQVEVVQ